jgi:mono/diheme cytochrome c family protein
MSPLLSHRRSLLGSIVAGALLLGALSLGLAPRESAPAPVEPASTIRGRRLFVQSCTHCHGDDARGSGEDGDGPDLHRLAIGNARIAAVIRTGIPEEMPSFAKKLGPPEVADVTAYLRTLR